MEKTQLATIKEEINKELSDPSTLASLVNITFKGLTQDSAKQALLEGMMLGFKFQDFLQKNVYAIPYGGGYSLVGSIDYCRKIGMRSGVVGVTKPIYTEDANGNILTCEITVKKKVNEYIGDFTSLVYFREFNTGRNQWAKMPRVMIAKVAEMHALRKACPEELSKLYVEEEGEQNIIDIQDIEERKKQSKVEWFNKMTECESIDELKSCWASMPGEIKKDEEILSTKEDLKIKLSENENKKP